MLRCRNTVIESSSTSSFTLLSMGRRRKITHETQPKWRHISTQFSPLRFEFVSRLKLSFLLRSFVTVRIYLDQLVATLEQSRPCTRPVCVLVITRPEAVFTVGLRELEYLRLPPLRPLAASVSFLRQCVTTSNASCTERTSEHQSTSN